jgi:aldehyde:ferredoxin oxidoreductase
MGESAGRLVVVDLSTGEIENQDIPETSLKVILAGRGLNALLLGRYLDREGIDPLGPENVLIFSNGLLTGTKAPSSSRLHVGALSPQTGLLGSSNVGGHFGAALRDAGVQSLVIRGRASRPAMLWIDGDRVEIVDADRLWGLDTRAASELLRGELGQDSRFLVIGAGGENLVRYACILTDSRHAAGRTGMGAVMGSKNIKAIAVRGARSRNDRATDHAAKRVVRDYVDRIRAAPRYETFARYSNSAFVNWANESGLLATHNYREVTFEGAERIDGERLIDYVTRSRTCYRCPVHCKAEIKIPDGRYKGTVGERPDIEPIINLGSKCGLGDPEAVLYLYNLTGTLGLDAISTAGVLAFAMDLYEQGIISAKDTGGIELTWGNAEAMEAMMRQIARREGFGHVLAGGVRLAAQSIGRGAATYAYHAKGLELTAYDARGGMGTALGYAVSTRGGDFTSVYAVPEFRWTPEQGRKAFGTEQSVDRLSTEGKGKLVRRTMCVSAVLDALGLCKVPVLSIVSDYSLENEAELVSALTGWEVEADDLALIGERIVNLERLFNFRHGARRGDDDLPDHFTEEPVVDPGPTQGMTVDIQPMVQEFYSAMGWDDEGRPTVEKLRELGLDRIVSC